MTKRTSRVFLLITLFLGLFFGIFFNATTTNAFTDMSPEKTNNAVSPMLTVGVVILILVIVHFIAFEKRK